MIQIELVAVLEEDGPPAIGVPQDPRKTIRAARASSFSISVLVIDLAGAAVDLTGRTCTFRVKHHSDSEETVIAKTVLLGDQQGIATFTFSPTDTRQLDAGRYVYDVWIDDQPGVPISPFLLEPSTHGY